MNEEQKLLGLLTYKPESGLFFWNESRGKAKKGDKAGYVMSNGYIGISFNKRIYKAHRLAWFFMNGEMPALEIDHINCDKSDNRICNLREVSRTENIRNRGMHKRNSSGVKGVSWKGSRGKWETRIGHMNGRIHLGMFSDLELAELVVSEAREKYHGEYANHGRKCEKIHP
ncbi:HNH endonuclease [Morganella morganii]|uniref:HNH endonuclease n=1 Tax=Morganella morganii TaxID=582 RepID=UPI0034E3A780